MNPAQIHLWLNHLPAIFILVAIAILAVAILKGSQELRVTAASLLVVAALVTIPVYLSGEPTEEIVENKPMVSKTDLHEHELAAKFALTWAEVLGAYALVLLFLGRKKKVRKGAWLGLLFLGIFTMTVFLRTHHLGGLIRHDELRGASPMEVAD